jgi:hypothetical protein
MVTEVIDGSKSIDEIQRAIAGFEAGFKKYVSNEIPAVGGSKTNKITFEELILELPNEFKLTLATAGPPAGFSKIRQDAMFVQGKNVQVIAWRKDQGASTGH